MERVDKVNEGSEERLQPKDIKDHFQICLNLSKFFYGSSSVRFKDYKPGSMSYIWQAFVQILEGYIYGGTRRFDRDDFFLLSFYHCSLTNQKFLVLSIPP